MTVLVYITAYIFGAVAFLRVWDHEESWVRLTSGVLLGGWAAFLFYGAGQL